MLETLGISDAMAIACAWLFWAVATDMVAIYALVRSRGFRAPAWALLSLVMIFLSFMGIRRVVLVIPLGVTYALWCVFGIFGTIAIGRIAFHQTISRRKGVGIVLLTLGIVCMSMA